MTKFLSVVLILTMMTGVYAVSAMAQGSARIITDSIQRYGADLAARLRTINLTGLALFETKMASVRQAVARQAASLLPRSAKAFAVDYPSVAWPLAAGSGGEDGAMIIHRTKPAEANRAHSARNEARGTTLIRRGHSQMKSIPRIRGQDGATMSPDAPDDS